MRASIIILISILLLTNCSTKKDNAKTNQVNDSTSSDSILFKGSYTFKKITRDDGLPPIYIKETTDFYSNAGHDKKIIIKSALNVTEPSNWYPQYHLILEAYNPSNTKEPIWKKEIKDEAPVGMWNDYLQTVQFGCCDSEDGNSLYDTNTGNKILMFTGKPMYASLEKVGFVFYQSASGTNFDSDLRKKNDGFIFITQRSEKISENIKSYTIQLDSTYTMSDMFGHTPEFEVDSKHTLRDEGFFRAFKLFSKGIEIQKLDTAANYLKLNFGFKHFVLVPFDKQENLLEDELICTDKELSKNFLLLKK